jgi:small ligand-binding sensory domain FIST
LPTPVGPKIAITAGSGLILPVSIVSGMAVHISSGLSTLGDARAAALDASARARAGLAGAPVSLAVVFAAGAHLAAPEALLEGVHEALRPRALIGCGAGGVLGDGEEIEDGTAVAVWAASLSSAEITAFHAHVEPLDEDSGAVVGMPDASGAAALLLLPDPYSFPTEQLLEQLRQHAGGVPVLGGISSARTLEDSAALFLGEEVFEEGVVGVRLDGVELLPCVSQGAAPVGPELTVTAAEGDVIHELAGAPALRKLREIAAELPAPERALVTSAPLIGLALEHARSDYAQGDFLVRNVLASDRDGGSVAVGAPVRAGHVVRLHVRDAARADRDLRDALALRRLALGDSSVAGALMFTCNGRGRALFGDTGHDTRTLARELLDPPAAGFFCAGEIGPVGGESHLHGFSASVAVFPA